MTMLTDRPPTAGRTSAEVELSGLIKRYGGTVAVDQLSLTVPAGEFVALLGPSGCGKSTTLRMLAGLEQPDSGQVRLSGVDVTGVPAHRRDIHTVFQSYALFPHLSVADNVAFPLRQRGVPRAEIRSRVAEALALVQLPAIGDQAVTSLSGGQQQRVALARAVVDRPGVLLLDEPLSALDRSLRQAMQVELRLLQQNLGVTTVLVTHDQEEALSLADRIVIMSDGRAEQIGTAEEVYDFPDSLFVARFVGEQNELTGTVDERGRFGHPEVTIVGDRPEAGPSIALIRPEHVRVGPISGPADVNAIDGIVRGVSIAGISSVVLVHCRDLTLLARVPRDGRPLPHVGDQVRCSWDTAHVRIFRGES
ncbi:ABC transporter ATP-binding protein [Kribbella sandramycini]|uniref:Spermidine/putrescine import ATP-binding protein PotA n=1 Tax=Kribbella sandramycini TaxID=60450 RepID=A0A7Y4NZM5_9ACTN|nr:ABC transporter ATP-binding protein [Kribbella sandramycini]MBB6569880.1 spermidine/putrescine ABC transporter ATP-binding subunit [Kribbella sandramycini]NOL40295.1 ABC transporter ATP-binding protein [Kribbella sandramycini]